MYQCKWRIITVFVERTYRYGSVERQIWHQVIFQNSLIKAVYSFYFNEIFWCSKRISIYGTEIVIYRITISYICNKYSLWLRSKVIVYVGRKFKSAMTSPWIGSGPVTVGVLNAILRGSYRFGETKGLLIFYRPTSETTRVAINFVLMARQGTWRNFRYIRYRHYSKAY